METEAQVSRHKKRMGSYLTVTTSDGTEVAGNTPEKLAKEWSRYEFGDRWGELSDKERAGDIAERLDAIQAALEPPKAEPAAFTEEQKAIIARLKSSRAQIAALVSKVDSLQQRLSEEEAKLDQAQNERWKEVESALREQIPPGVIIDSSGIPSATFYRRIDKRRA
ncbi:hypothetical protein [Prauserella muralis]|uniref:hypothetical protein n=1 Tax=Prauserella muralis TaxID=588067 RepID=UPI0011AD39E1|nr:hypothetical protein [Prauserella muralis]TWE27565.1 hypothetical protein FHX69_0201 [Prauserella muralis]